MFAPSHNMTAIFTYAQNTNTPFFESILNAKEQWLISEFLNTQPMQFMYNVTSKVVGKYIFKSRTDSL